MRGKAVGTHRIRAPHPLQQKRLRNPPAVQFESQPPFASPTRDWLSSTGVAEGKRDVTATSLSC